MRAVLLFLALVLSATQANGAKQLKESGRTAPDPTQQKGLELLFTGVFQYRSESESDSVVNGEGRQGVFIGSGDGTVTGKQIQGTVRWSLWTGNCVYPAIRKGQAIPEGLHLCTMDPGGLIQTSDGGRIRFDGRGYGLRAPDKYRTSVILVFGTEDERYAWLIKLPAVMEGEFDEKSGRAIWHVYVPAGSHRGRW